MKYPGDHARPYGDRARGGSRRRGRRPRRPAITATTPRTTMRAPTETVHVGGHTVGAGLAPPAATAAVSRATMRVPTETGRVGGHAVGADAPGGPQLPPRYPGRGKPRPYGHQYSVTPSFIFHFPFSIFHFAVPPSCGLGRPSAPAGRGLRPHRRGGLSS